MTKLTPRQHEYLTWIKDYLANNGFAPSVRDIQKGFGLKSPNGVAQALAVLVEKGAITRAGKFARSIVVLDWEKNGTQREATGNNDVFCPHCGQKITPQPQEGV